VLRVRRYWRTGAMSCAGGRPVPTADPSTFYYCPLLPLTAPYCPLLPLTAPYCPYTAPCCPFTAPCCPLTAPCCPISSPVLSQTKLSTFWPGRKWPAQQDGETSAAAGTPTKSSTPKASSSRKRLRDRVVSAAVEDAANALTWRVDGVAVPVEPPSWCTSTSNALLSAHIAAHNSFVSARAAQEMAIQTAQAYAKTFAPAAKRRRGVSPSADADGADTTGSGLDGEPPATVTPLSPSKLSPRARPAAKATAGGTASEDALPRGTRGKPRIQALRSCLTKRMHNGILAPSTNDDVYHSRETLRPFLAAVVMEVAKVDKKDAEKLLLTNFSVPAVNNSKLPSSKMLKPWLGKTRNNVHFNLKDCIFRAWTAGSGYGGTSKAETRRFLHGRGYLRGANGRRGVLNAFLAVVSHCGGDPDKYTFPDGDDGDALASTVLATLAFVLSKVRYWRHGRRVYCGWGVAKAL